MKGFAVAIQVSDNVTVRDYWKLYIFMKGIYSIPAAGSEVSKSRVNGSWRKLWPDSIRFRKSTILPLLLQQR
jgi:hypothetical protein